MNPKHTASAYFVFEQKSPEGEVKLFVFELSDVAKIEQARRILAEKSANDSVQGNIIQSRTWYNPEWSFHLDPSSIAFFEKQIEVCDANVTYVEKHLDEVGGSFLPKSVWCPWSSRLSAEVTDKVKLGTMRPA
ncbi:calmodulin [Mesorhizobium sp. M0664]|uniref:BP74-related protein n=1 Tax=Mesorhizobium sp. M0664 TaxID=2956982 RepID=UPI00333AFF1E